MKIHRANQSQPLKEEGAENASAYSLKAPAFSLATSPSGEAGAEDEAGTSLLAVQTTQSANADEGGNEDDPKARLDKLLHRNIFQHKNQIPELVYALAPDEKLAIRESELYRQEICKAIKKESELIRKTILALDGPLSDKISWMTAWQSISAPGMPRSYSAVSEYVKSAPQAEKEALATPEFKKIFGRMFADVGGYTGMMNDLNFDLGTKLDWYKDFAKNSARFGDIKPWLTSAGNGALQVLSNPGLKSWLIGLCTPGELIQTGKLIGLGLIGTVEWLIVKENSGPFKLTMPQMNVLLNSDAAEVTTLLSRYDTKNFVLLHITLEEMAQLMATSKMELIARVRLLHAKYDLQGAKLTYQHLRPMILAAPDGERAALNAPETKEIFKQICDKSTILTAVQDLKFDLATKLDWLAGMNVKLKSQDKPSSLDYAAVRPIIAGAEGADKDYLQTQEGQDQVMSIGAGKTIGDAMQDINLKLPLAQKIERVYHAAGIESVQVLLDGEAQGARDKIWSDKKRMADFRKLMGDDDYLTLICALRMRFAGKSVLEKAADVDKAIREHLGAYVKGPVKNGLHFEGQVAVVDDHNWDIAGIMEQGADKWATDGKHKWAGFVDAKRRAFVHKDVSQAGTMVHEAVHKYSDLGSDGVLYISQPLNEGMTEYFTRKVCVSAKIEIRAERSYEDNYKCVKKMVALLGEQVVASAFFDGPGSLLADAYIKKKGKNGAANWDKFIEYTKANKWAEAAALL